MKQFKVIKVILLMLQVIELCDGKKPKCLSVPTLPAKVEKFIKTCQSVIKTNIIDDLVFATLNEHRFTSAEAHDLLKPHIDLLHYKHKQKHSHHHHHDHHNHHNSHILKPIVHYDHSYEYFHPDHSHSHEVLHQFAHSHEIPSHHFNVQPHIIESVEEISYPEHLIDGNYRFVTPLPLGDEQVHETETIDSHKVIEAHEELMNILANHKVVERDVNNHTAKNVDDDAKRVKRRTFFGFFDFNNDKSKNDDEKLLDRVVAPTHQFHPALLSNEDKWMAGCLLHCIYDKTHSLDKHGYPTLDGIVDLYTAGTHDQHYFIYMLRAVNKCLKIVSIKHQIHRSKLPFKFETCDIAFDLFDCVSDAVTEYCYI